MVAPIIVAAGVAASAVIAAKEALRAIVLQVLGPNGQVIVDQLLSTGGMMGITTDLGRKISGGKGVGESTATRLNHEMEMKGFSVIKRCEVLAKTYDYFGNKPMANNYYTAAKDLIAGKCPKGWVSCAPGADPKTVTIPDPPGDGGTVLVFGAVALALFLALRK